MNHMIQNDNMLSSDKIFFTEALQTQQWLLQTLESNTGN